MRSASQLQRPVAVSREGSVFRLAFQYDPALVETIRQLPYAAFDPATKSWTCAVCTQSLEQLRQLRWQGLVDDDPDELIEANETLPKLAGAIVAAGSVRRPFVIRTALRNDLLYARLTSITGSRWDKNAQGVSYPPQAATALAELVDAGLLDDPGKLLTPADVTVSFDTRIGKFKVRGDDRAAQAFAKHFPEVDVVELWRQRNLDVAFADGFSEEIYGGELARRSEGFQPAGMAIALYNYQKVDVAVALERRGVGVFSSMGVGKTVVAVAVGHELLYNRQEVPRVVVVVPPGVRSQWRDEIIRFTGCDPSEVVVVDGDRKRRMRAYEDARNARWLVVHYQAIILPDDAKLVTELVTDALLVCDEAHRLKNETTKMHKTVKSMATKAARRILLTGTPVENNPGEWFNLLNLVHPGVFGSAVDFLNRYSFPGRFGGFEGARNIPELRERSKPLYVRRSFAEVAGHLPPLRVQTIKLDPRPEYMSALRRAHREAADEIRNRRLLEADQRRQRTGNVLDGYEREELEAGAEMTAVGMLRLLCCSPRIVAASESSSAEALRDSGLVPDEDGPKLDELRVMAAEMKANGDRMVVFTSSKRMADLVSVRLNEDGVAHVVYTGDTSTADRDAAVKAFTTAGTEQDAGPVVFLSTDAGAEGLNLGRCCSTLVNLDIPWTPGRLSQRNARVRRVDSTASGFLVVNLVLRGTLEEGILKMVEYKADLADAVLGETGGRKATTGRGGRNQVEALLVAWGEDSGSSHTGQS